MCITLICSTKANDTQWWELYDQKTRRYYYYCAGTDTTVWHKPKDVEIIALSKLQVLFFCNSHVPETV